MVCGVVIIPTFNEIENIENIIRAVFSLEKTFHVLIVDDNSLNLKVAEMILEGWGMKVTSVLGARLAIEALKEELPDLVLMDLQMPEIDGYEATEMIRKQFPQLQKIPIIALTASATRDVKDKAIAAGLDDFVTKPFVPDKLKEVLLSHI